MPTISFIARRVLEAPTREAAVLTYMQLMSGFAEHQAAAPDVIAALAADPPGWFYSAPLYEACEEVYRQCEARRLAAPPARRETLMPRTPRKEGSSSNRRSSTR